MTLRKGGPPSVKTPFILFVFIAALVAATDLAHAELVFVCTDAKVAMVNGRQAAVPNPPQDTLAIIDLGAAPPRLVAEIEGIPSSIAGPPVGLAVTPDAGLALVVCATKTNPENPARGMPDDRLTVVDLKARQVVATLSTGTTPTGVAMNRAGTLALVGSRTGAISIFQVKGKTVTPAGKYQVLGETGNLSNLAFAPDGKTVVACCVDHLVVIEVDGVQLGKPVRTLPLGARPYTVDFARDGRAAAFTVLGNPNGGSIEKVGLIGLETPGAEAVTVAVSGPTPESVRFSPDGTLCAVVEFNGTTRAKDAPNYSPRGKLELFSVARGSLTRVGEAAIGGWGQTAIFSADNRTLLVTNAVEHELQVLHWDGKALTDPHLTIPLKGAPTLMATAVR